MITEVKSRRIAQYAFEYAVLNNRKKARQQPMPCHAHFPPSASPPLQSVQRFSSLLVPAALPDAAWTSTAHADERRCDSQVTCVHKANIMKLTDGLFLKVCGEIAKSYPTIQYDAVIVDNACMQARSLLVLLRIEIPSFLPSRKRLAGLIGPTRSILSCV